MDLTGQVCVDQFEGEFYGGVSTQAGFIRGAARSPGAGPLRPRPMSSGKGCSGTRSASATTGSPAPRKSVGSRAKTVPRCRPSSSGRGVPMLAASYAANGLEVILRVADFARFTLDAEERRDAFLNPGPPSFAHASFIASRW